MDGVFGSRPLEDVWRVLRAVASNQLARLAPGTYVRVTGETGRGKESIAPAETARYFMECVLEYLDVLGVPRQQLGTFWAGKRVVEYGPGDIPGVALLLAGLGAGSIVCVDRFPLVRFNEYQQQVIGELAKLLPTDEARSRMQGSLRGSLDRPSGLQDGLVSYRITPSGLLGEKECADIILSRAVLEHVNDLPGTFRDIAAGLVPGGWSVHKVDLKSHGLHRRNPLDFLTWPASLWHLMYSEKGAPNRHRVDRYEQEALSAGLTLQLMRAQELAEPQEVASVRPYLAREFRHLTDEQLRWLSFWIVCRRDLVRSEVQS